jgi:hypothetical protein
MDVDTIFDRMESTLAALGIADVVNMHEPKKAPGNGVAIATWPQGLRAVPGMGGLNKTTVVIDWAIRFTTNMLTQPGDRIEREMLKAADVVGNAINGDFTLGGAIRNVDILGAHSRGITFDAGYMDQDGKKYRTYMMRVPLIVDDIWEQVA